MRKWKIWEILSTIGQAIAGWVLYFVVGILFCLICLAIMELSSYEHITERELNRRSRDFSSAAELSLGECYHWDSERFLEDFVKAVGEDCMEEYAKQLLEDNDYLVFFDGSDAVDYVTERWDCVRVDDIGDYLCWCTIDELLELSGITEEEALEELVDDNVAEDIVSDYFYHNGLEDITWIIGYDEFEVLDELVDSIGKEEILKYLK